MHGKLADRRTLPRFTVLRKGLSWIAVSDSPIKFRSSKITGFPDHGSGPNREGRVERSGGRARRDGAASASAYSLYWHSCIIHGPLCEKGTTLRKWMNNEYRFPPFPAFIPAASYLSSHSGKPIRFEWKNKEEDTETGRDPKERKKDRGLAGWRLIEKTCWLPGSFIRLPRTPRPAPRASPAAIRTSQRAARVGH